MGFKCNNKDILLNFIKQKHTEADFSHPTELVTKIDFPNGLVVNVFNTGTVNFQGDSFENRTASDIITLIDIINR